MVTCGVNEEYMVRRNHIIDRKLNSKNLNFLFIEGDIKKGIELF
jgi:hypothetical protein